MMLIGVDCHPSFQQIAFFVEETSECGEQELNPSDGRAKQFYRGLVDTQGSDQRCKVRYHLVARLIDADVLRSPA
jgi:hypothetical protein